MTEKIGRPTDAQNAKNDEFERDLHPEPMAGHKGNLNAPQAEATAPTAYEIKELHQLLSDYSSDELKQIVLVPQGTRLEQGAKYLDLMGDRQEFTAMGNQSAEPGHWYVPKTEMEYPLWNKLRGITDPDRLDEAR
jgi:hypothetical protein